MYVKFILPRFLLTLLLGVSATMVWAQTGFFEPASSAQMRTAAQAASPIPTAKLYQLKTAALRSYMAKAPLESQAGAAPLELAIPLPNGATEVFVLRQTQVLSPALAAEHPSFKTFAGTGTTHPNYVIRMSFSSLGFEALIWGVDGDAVYVAKVSAFSADELYRTYFSRDARKAMSTRSFGPVLRCGTVDSPNKPTLPGLNTGNGKARTGAAQINMGSTVRTFRLAIATTGEWTRNAGGFPDVTDPVQLRSNAIAVVVTTVNRINGIFERELSSKFMLVNPLIGGSSNIIFDNPATDPYDNTDNATKDSPNNQLVINQNTLNNNVGTANYDIGHLYGTGGGGVAYKRSLCYGPLKAGGYSARGTDTGDPFVVDYVAHEIGHQFGMDHTYNTSDNGGACTTRAATEAYEVASGSTLMSYVGICNEGRNLQQYVDTALPSFHISSLNQANTYLTTSIADDGAAGCGTSAGANNIPTVSAVGGYVIPRLTPFTLSAMGGDADASDVPNLLYSWEQLDLAPSASGFNGVPANTYDVDADGVLRPLFRAYSPVSSPLRTFPSLTYILNPQANATPGENQPPLLYTGTNATLAPGATCKTGETCVVGEHLPAIARTLNFRVTVRDRRGGVADGATSVTVVNTPGAFRTTSFDSATQVAGGSQQTITWNVVNTDQAPISCANVQILLSTDGGLTFPTVLLATTPNDGSESVTFPNVTTTMGRIKVMAVDNIFFDISNTNLSISPTVTPPPSSLTITSFVCNTTSAGLSSVNFVVGYLGGSFTPAVPALFINGVTNMGQLGQTYMYAFDSNQNTITVQDQANRTTYFTWNFRAACATTPPPPPPSSLTITSFVCNSTSAGLSSVNFVVGYPGGSFTPAVPALFINGVTASGQLGQTYMYAFDSNQSMLTVQDQANRTTYFTWNFRAACATTTPPPPPSSLTITSFTCNTANSVQIVGNSVLSSVNFVVGYVGGSFTPAVAPLFINGVTNNGQLGQTYMYAFDNNQSMLPVQDQANRTTYFTWNFRAACSSSSQTAARLGVEENAPWQVSVLGNPTGNELTIALTGAQGQVINLTLADGSGRAVVSRKVQPQTNQHYEVFDVSAQPAGMLFMQATGSTYRQSLKVLKQ